MASNYDGLLRALRPTRGVIVIMVAILCGYTLTQFAPNIASLLVLDPRHVWTHPWQIVTCWLIPARLSRALGPLFLLWLFGPNLERRVGTAQFFHLMLGSSIAAGLVWALLGFNGYGSDPMAEATIAAVGLAYGSQPVDLWGTGTIIRYSLLTNIFVGFGLFMFTIDSDWMNLIGSIAAIAYVYAALRWTGYRSILERVKGWRSKRRYTVLTGGKTTPPKQRYMN